ncbi:MAG: MarR family transcriptional regulator [Parasporobacterium sp.]|nr:MarR family transcriptional regulator [Parasporobacterium sp.]
MKDFDPLKLENQICFPLYAAARKVTNLYTPFLSELDLTYTQYIVMLVLWEQDGISVKELGQKLYLDSGTLTPLLKNLEKKGFVTRSRSKEDERSTIAVLTKEGKELREKAIEIPGQVGNCIQIAPEDAIQLYQLLYKVLNVV